MPIFKKHYNHLLFDKDQRRAIRTTLKVLAAVTYYDLCLLVCMYLYKCCK